MRDTKDPYPEPASSLNIAAFIDRINHGVAVFDERLDLIYANRTGAELLGLPQTDPVKPVDPAGPPDDRGAAWTLACREAFESQATGVFETYHAPSARWYEYRIYPSKREIVVCITDITDRKVMQAALEVRAEKYRNLVETAHDLIWSVDADGRITFINRAAREIYGYEPEELIGRDFRDLVSPENRARQEEIFAAQPDPDNRFVYRQEVEVMHRSGERRILLANAVRLYDEEGIPVGSMGTSVDITARKSAESELNETHDNLRALSHRLRELQEAERRAITAELHDRIGQNLTGLGILIQKVRGRIPEEDADVYAAEFDLLQALVRETTRHVRDIMAELVPPELEDYGLAAALESFADRAAAAGGLELEVDLPDLPPPPPPVEFSLVLFRAAQEAVHNVLKHAGAARLTVRLAEREGVIRLEIADDGNGFAPDTPLEDALPAWGLKILRERIESIDGELAIETRAGEGTRVVIEVRRPV